MKNLVKFDEWGLLWKIRNHPEADRFELRV